METPFGAEVEFHRFAQEFTNYRIVSIQQAPIERHYPAEPNPQDGLEIDTARLGIGFSPRGGMNGGQSGRSVSPVGMLKAR